ncbi:MAG: hypothetical protein V7638_3824 [Acidobacteriota bacterium]|jgi:hypothetical protein
MGTFAGLLANLKVTTKRIVEGMASDSAFVMRASRTSNSKGGKVGSYAATTQQPYSCFSSPVSEGQVEREQMRASQRKPGVFHRFTFAADVDVLASDRLRRVATRGLAQTDMEIIRVTDMVGLTREVIAFEETPL